MIISHGLRAATRVQNLSVPTYISISSNSAATGTSLTITTPASALRGDLLVVNILGSVNGTWTAPSGWTMYVENGRYRGWTEYDGTTANYTFTTDTSAIICGAIMCIRNASWDVNGANTATATTNPVAPAITVQTNNSLLFGVPCVTNNDGTAYSAPAGWTQRFQAATDTTDGSIAIFQRDTTANAGTTGTVAFTRSAGTNTASRAYLFSLRPKSIVPITVSFFASSTSTASTITLPANIQAGDLIVLFDRGGSPTTPPAAVTPTGFTTISNLSLSASTAYRAVTSYKKAVGTEGGTSITGVDGSSFDQKICLVFRPTVNSTLTLSATVNQEMTSANPTSQTVTCSSETNPLVVIGCYGSSGAISPRTFSPTQDGEVSQASSLYMLYKIYNSSPQNTTVDMDDEGNGNTLVSFYITFS